MRQLTSNEWWNAALSRSIRTIWHWVGFYVVVDPITSALTEALVVGEVPTVSSFPVSSVATIMGTLGLAVSLSVLRPAVSSARTLAFGFVGWLLFVLLLVLFGDINVVLSGTALVGLDVALAALAAVTLSAAVALGFDFEDLRPEYGRDQSDDTGGDSI